MEFRHLGRKERLLLLKALDFDTTELYCQHCEDQVTFGNCAILPSVKTKLLATILCDSPLCMCWYLEQLEK